jgi:RNA polymerase sigma-70 factor (ECF subfamily)
VTIANPEPSDDSNPSEALLATAALLSRARAGDPGAQRELFELFEPVLRRLLHARVPANARGLLDTDDLVQEVYGRVFQRLESFEYRGPGSFWGYLRRVGLNYVAAVARRSESVQAPRNASESSLDGIGPEPSPSSALSSRERFAEFEAALQELPELQRQALLMRLELDLPFSAIAAECGFPSADAARMAVKRVIEVVVKRMSDDQPA